MSESTGSDLRRVICHTLSCPPSPMVLQSASIFSSVKTKSRLRLRRLTWAILFALIAGSCSRSIEDAFPRYQLSPDVTQSSGEFFLSTEGLMQRDSAAVETEVVKCSGSLRGIRQVVSGFDIVLVVDCGSEF
jgi:hypothetical protein